MGWLIHQTSNNQLQSIEDAERVIAYQTRIIDQIHDAVIVTDIEGKITNWNNGAETLFGYNSDEIYGQYIYLLFPQIKRYEIFQDKYIDYLKEHGFDEYEAIMKNKSGEEINVETSTSLLTNESGEIEGVISYSKDISERKQIEGEYRENHKLLSYQASHDALTNLINRKEFGNRLQNAIETAHSDETTHALCYLDLDQFKIINDTCGHVAGDNLLQQLSLVMQQHVSKRDTLARLGGDEFGVLLMYCDSDWALEVVKKLHNAIENFIFQWEGKNFRVGASIGIVIINESTESTSEILKKADAACFAAKDAGRNRIHVYEENDIDIAKRRGEFQWVSRIHNALEKNLFCLNVQDITPISIHETGDHYEVLIRMIGDNGDLIPPGAFLPTAERYNLSPRIDRWVITSTLEWLSEHPQRLEQLALCSINLSGNSLCDDEFLNFIVNTLESTIVPPYKICFEVTETAAIANLTGAIKLIKKVKEYGCFFALDDFGSGLSSFAYLKNLPVDILKIDGLFIKDIATNSVDFAMVKSINEIGHVMGKQTVAEFVEDEEIVKKLKEIGVDFAQGYYFSKPHPLDDLAALAEVI